jgi:cytochrome P450
MQNSFNDQDPVRHSALRRKVAAAYLMSSLVSYEPYVDANTTIFLQRMTERASAGVILDMGHWFQCYAFEVIMQISVGLL